MPPTKKVTWLGRASDKISASLIPGFERELQKVFPHSRTIVIYDCFGGYTQNHAEKVVLGVEVSTATSYHTHVVKIGTRRSVETDYLGWQRCVLRFNVGSRVLVSLTKHDLSRDRVAVIYEDAYRYFGAREEGHGPHTLETAVFWSVLDGKPSPSSVERVIRQIYTDFNNCFYRNATPNPESAMRFFRARLRKAIRAWESEAWRRDLRRDFLWLVCRQDRPDDLDQVSMLDPFDYACWALREKNIPQCLVGRSHGDLHGRNVFVGVQRGEAEYPTTFDYGEMRDTNPIVWDFVKLEIELKVRLLLELYEIPASREAMLSAPVSQAGQLAVPHIAPGAAVKRDTRALRANQLAFAYKFELLLAELTERFHKLKSPDAVSAGEDRTITGDERIDRALHIFLRIRKEAALFLGDSKPQRGKRGLWRDEYYFGLCVYGLSTAKYDYKEVESAFALVSSGVACTNISLALKAVRQQAALKRPPQLDEAAAKAYPYPSYRVPIAHARRLWKAGSGRRGLSRAVDLLAHAAKHYDHSVAVLQEYALVLAEHGDHVRAMDVIGPLDDLCRVFGDAESLSRIGRTCKDLGDLALRESPVAIEGLADHPARQWYFSAFQHYREAFELSQEYYPGVNAATLAWIIGMDSDSRQLAQAVLNICSQLDLTRMSADERFWTLCSQGEAHLLLHETARSVSFYQQALSALPAEEKGMAQSAHAQLMRMQWALGKDIVGPVCRVFNASRFFRKQPTSARKRSSRG